MLETDVVAVENALLAGDHVGALVLAADALAREEALGGSAIHGATLRRLLGEAALALGRVDDTRRELEASIALADDHGAEYERALALTALERLGRLTGEGPDPARTAESHEILERLQVRAVVWTPVRPPEAAPAG